MPLKSATPIILAALALASCGPKTLALPENPVDRAATCGVVAAANARQSSGTAAGTLPIDQQLGLMHYALLAGASGDSFSLDDAAAVAKRMPELEGDVTRGKWQELVQPCAEAFPQTQDKGAVALPGDKLRAQLGCYGLADFVQQALQRQDASYGDELARYGAIKRALDGRIGAGVVRQGGDAEESVGMRKAAMAELIGLGPLAGVMKACLAAYEPD